MIAERKRIRRESRRRDKGTDGLPEIACRKCTAILKRIHVPESPNPHYYCTADRVLWVDLCGGICECPDVEHKNYVLLHTKAAKV